MSGMSSSLEAYLELSGPKAMVVDDYDNAVRQQRADCTSFHSENQKCHINSSKLILPGKGNEKRPPQYRVCGIISLR